jgi:hypothetical protein
MWRPRGGSVYRRSGAGWGYVGARLYTSENTLLSTSVITEDIGSTSQTQGVAGRRHPVSLRACRDRWYPQ